MPSSEYADLMRSRHWQQVRRLAHQGKPAKCNVCGERGVPLDVHHLTYRTMWSRSTRALRLVCRRCHDEIHVVARKEGLTALRATALVKRRKRGEPEDIPRAGSKQLTKAERKHLRHLKQNGWVEEYEAFRRSRGLPSA